MPLFIPRLVFMRLYGSMIVSLVLLPVFDSFLSDLYVRVGLSHVCSMVLCVCVVFLFMIVFSSFSHLFAFRLMAHMSACL